MGRFRARECMSSDLSSSIARFLRRPLQRIVEVETQYVVFRQLPEGKAPSALHTSPDIELCTVESLEDLEKVAPQLPPELPIAGLRRRIDAGCTLFFARRRLEGRVVAYQVAERRVFSALGLRVRVRDDVLFIHHVEVLPEYRGQRISLLLRAAAHRYCQTHHLRRTLSVISTDNRASLRAHLRQGAPGGPPQIVCVVRRVSVLNGRFSWQTSWRKIEKAIRRATAGQFSAADPAG